MRNRPIEAELQIATAEMQQRHRIVPQVIARNPESPNAPDEFFQTLLGSRSAADILVNYA
jgi:hypothetical protein